MAGVFARFNNGNFENPYSDIKNLSQTRILREYIKEFDFLFNKIEPCEEVVVGIFIGGLRKEIKSMVLMLQPCYLREAGLEDKKKITITCVLLCWEVSTFIILPRR